MPVHKHDGYVPTLGAYRPVTRGDGLGIMVGPRAALVSSGSSSSRGRNWVAAARGKEALAFTARQAFAVEEIVDAIQESAIYGTRVPLA